MEVEQMKRFTDDGLRFATELIQTQGHLLMTFLVFSQESVAILQLTEPEAANDRAAKAALTDQVRVAVADTSAIAVVQISDCWFGAINLDERSQELAKSMKYSSAELEQMGAVKRREAVVAVLETPIYAEIKTQFYRHEGSKIVLEETLTFDSQTDPGMTVSGRCMGFFSGQPQRATV